MVRTTASVIICTYAAMRWDQLYAAVRSVEGQEGPAPEVVIAVDHNPALADRCRVDLPGSVVVENQGTPGLSGARNAGVEAAGGEVIVFLDDDAVAAPDWLRWIANGYDDTSVVGVGGAIIPDWTGKRPGWFPEEFDWVVGCTYRGMPTSPTPVRNLIGANMSFRREVFDTVGLFRTGIGRVGTLPMGCEETELCIRIRQRYPDSRLIFDPRARVYHHVPAQLAGWRYFARRCYAEGRSKTAVARSVGVTDGLESERQYTFHTLPAGALRGMADTIRSGRPAGLMRAGAIAGGLAITTAGYAIGHVIDRREYASSEPSLAATLSVSPSVEQR